MPCMKNIWLCSVILFCCVGVRAQDVPRVHKLQLWGTFTSNRKLVFIAGFTNGLLAGEGRPLCGDDSTEVSSLL
jgi:hypothetical protein